jgi:hypothetical protein
MIKDLMVAVYRRCQSAVYTLPVSGGPSGGFRPSRRPGLLVLTSFLVRAGLTVSALYLILG